MASSSSSFGSKEAHGKARRAYAMLAALLMFLLAINVSLPPSASAQTVLCEEDTAATNSEVSFALAGFHKAKKGSDSPLLDGKYYGYRYLVGTVPCCVTIAADDVVIVYVPRALCDEFSLNLEDENQTDALYDMIDALDYTHSDGGTTLESLGADVRMTNEADFVCSGKRFRFDIESDGRIYAALLDTSNPDKSAGTALFCDYAGIVMSSAVAAPEQVAPLNSLFSFISSVDFSSLWVSVRTALVATLVVALLGIIIGWKATRASNLAQSLFDWFFSVSMVLPPTVLGFILLWLFGKYSPVGEALINIGIDLPFTWPAAVIAAAVVSFPYMYRAARAAFEEVDPDLLDAARTLGMSELRVMTRVLLPLSFPALATGVVLAFARALGEFGATLFFAGNYVGQTQTLPIAMYYDWMSGDERLALLWVLLIIAFSFISMFAINRVASATNRFR